MGVVYFERLHTHTHTHIYIYIYVILSPILISYLCKCLITTLGRVAQLVQRMATGWKVQRSDAGVGEIFRTCPDRPWGPPNLLYNWYQVFPGLKSGRGVKLTAHPLLVPWSRKTRAIPPLPLCAIRPVQSLSVCTGCTVPLPL